MKKFIKALIIGYATLWLVDTIKRKMNDNEDETFETLKRIIREKL